MIALLFAAFLVYLYAPHLVFKFAASGRYDFITRKDVPQVEEFFAAGLPSALLNGIAWLFFLVGPMERVILDRPVAASVFTKDPDLKAYFATGDAGALVKYISVLFVIAWICGRAYGNALRVIALNGGPRAYLSGASDSVAALARGVIVTYRKMWRPYYAQFEQPLYPQVLQQSFAFVHTTHGLYHGILYQYDKKQDGDLDGVYLIDVSRFSRKTEQQCYEAGQNPITDLDGPLFIKWSEIRDINYPHRGGVVLAEKRAFYNSKIAEYRRRRDPSWWAAIFGVLRKVRRFLAK